MFCLMPGTDNGADLPDRCVFMTPVERNFLFFCTINHFMNYAVHYRLRPLRYSPDEHPDQVLEWSKKKGHKPV